MTQLPRKTAEKAGSIVPSAVAPSRLRVGAVRDAAMPKAWTWQPYHWWVRGSIRFWFLIGERRRRSRGNFFANRLPIFLSTDHRLSLHQKPHRLHLLAQNQDHLVETFL